MKIEITFTEPVLGTVSGNKELTEDFIANKHPDGVQQEEIEAVPELSEALIKTSTVFARDTDGTPMLWDYQVKGFFKSACEAMIHSGTITKEELKKARLTKYLYKKSIDLLIFVKPRRIPFRLPQGGELTFCERPLRGDTMKGERIALARSEEAPAGITIQLEIKTLNPVYQQFIRTWLDYGALSGIGQWRNSGKGRFTWRELTSE